jgi:L-fuconolactonase
MTIDAHHHFWRYSAEEYGWIGKDMTALRRDFLPQDLQRETAAAGVAGVVSVQARQTLEETRWLLELAREHDFIRGVVGWAPLAAEDIGPILSHLAADPKLRALRHVLQDEADDHYMLRDDFNRGISLLKDHDLRYDILVFERHLPQTIEFVDRHPRQVFVLDHIGKPKISSGETAPWRHNIRELARRENVYCKVSGMVTEAEWTAWTPQHLRPYFDVVLDAFTPRRLMFGTDWPVCLLASGYQRWLETVQSWTASLTETERRQIAFDTAREAYGLQFMT